MLVYHPAFDAYHCVFRILALIETVPNLEIEKARLLDFYLSFPSAISSIKLPTSLIHGRQIAKSLTNVYRDPLNPKSVFRDMAEIQNSAIQCIAASGLIELEQYDLGILQKKKDISAPSSLLNKIAEYISGQGEVMSFITKDLAKIPLRGLHGLKHRTELLEYRYDAP